MKVSFETEQAWGDLRDWHPAQDLVIDLSDGRNQSIASLNWKNQDGSTASVSFQSNMTDFLGYYQKPGEGPIAYRGKRK